MCGALTMLLSNCHSQTQSGGEHIASEKDTTTTRNFPPGKKMYRTHKQPLNDCYFETVGTASHQEMRPRLERPC